jgi:cytidine deaminase
MTPESLMEAARAAMARAYAPYSRFQVGAALLGRSGRVYTGCNVENAAYGPSNCAERTAVFKAVSEGEREFTALAVAGGPEGKIRDFCPPCGVCRQVLREFCGPDFPVYLTDAAGRLRTRTLGELLPDSFSGENL